MADLQVPRVDLGEDEVLGVAAQSLLEAHEIVVLRISATVVPLCTSDGGAGRSSVSSARKSGKRRRYSCCTRAPGSAG